MSIFGYGSRGVRVQVHPISSMLHDRSTFNRRCRCFKICFLNSNSLYQFISIFWDQLIGILSDISSHRMASSENVASHWHAGKRYSVDIHSVGPVVFEVDVGATIPQSLPSGNLT